MLACLVILDYIAQVEQDHTPTRVPLLVVAGTYPAVMAMDAQAGRCGARRGMSLKQAHSLCPEAEVRPLVESRVREHFESVLELVSGFASRFEAQPPTKGADPSIGLDMDSSADILARVWHLWSGLYEQLHPHISAGIA
ncbi:MAG: hypothetical protein U0452_02350 [Anaerolineae bacterium]